MDRITLDAKAIQALFEKIDLIYEYVKTQVVESRENRANPAVEWLDNHQACRILEISPRSLQRLRSSGRITYSIRGGKARYLRAEIDRVLCGRVYHAASERNGCVGCKNNNE